MNLGVRGLAEELAAAEQDGRWVPLLTDRVDGLDWSAARSVARARDGLRREAGDTLIGYKLGWTSSAMREALGIERPNWGTLWTSQVLRSDLDVSRLHQPKVEPELVAEIGADSAPTRWCLGLEVVNPRFESYAFDWLDNTADNSSCARIVLGEWTELDDDPADVAIEFRDSETLEHGAGSNVTGGPCAAVEWLIGQLALEGEVVRPGDIVFTGGLATPFDVVSGGRVKVTSPSHPELGEVMVRVGRGRSSTPPPLR
jgi:2-keto-4-pentenoate hydratase